MKCGVPQGSILGPILFNMLVIRIHGINLHSCADDTHALPLLLMTQGG